MVTQAETGKSMNDGRPPIRGEFDEGHVVTLVLVTRKGTLITMAIDSRFDVLEEAWEETTKSEKSEKIVYRLVLAEDLPEATETLLEQLLKADRKILSDHAANQVDGFYPDSYEQWSKARFHMNVSEPPAAVSVALPFEVHWTGRSAVACCENVDLRLAKRHFHNMTSRLTHQSNSGHYIRTEWHPVPPCGLHVKHFLYIAYRRISLQFVTTPCQGPPICMSSPSCGVICCVDNIKVSS